MSEKKYVVPEGMRKAFSHAENHDGHKWDDRALYAMLEAAVCWLADNPIVPTNEEAENIIEKVFVDHQLIYGIPGTGSTRSIITASVEQRRELFAEWQRRMFLAPEPEMPEALKDLLNGDRFGDPTKPQITTNKAWDEAILEAYRRGRISHDEK